MWNKKLRAIFYRRVFLHKKNESINNNIDEFCNEWSNLPNKPAFSKNHKNMHDKFCYLKQMYYLCTSKAITHIFLLPANKN